MTDDQKPPEPEQKGSELKHLLTLIDLEYQAAHLALYGVATGISNHQFINQRLENMERMRERVVDLVGDEEQANLMVMEQLEKSDKAAQKTEKPEGGES